MGLTSNGIQKPIPDGLTLQSRYVSDPNTGISGHNQRIALVDARSGQSGEVAVANNSLAATLGTALSYYLDSITTAPRGSNYEPTINSSRLILTGQGHLNGIFISAASATPTIKLWDSLSATGSVLVDQFTPVAGQYIPFPARRVSTGIYITIGGTVVCSLDYDALIN